MTLNTLNMTHIEVSHPSVTLALLSASLSIKITVALGVVWSTDSVLTSESGNVHHLVRVALGVDK